MKLLDTILSSNSQFRSMTPAQKAYVLSMLVNKIFQNPKEYGLNEYGILRIGDKLDFTKLFENTKEMKLLFEKAQQTIVPGGFQEKSILENNEKIANWIKENPNANITSDQVGNILSNKPKEEKLKTEVFVEPEPKPMPEPVIITPETRAAETPKVETMSVLEKEKREAIHEQIEEAKKRLSHLENENSNNPNSNLEKTLHSDSRFAAMDSKFNQDLEEAFKNEINSVYGKSGLMGMGKTEGIKTKEWAEMARLPAAKVVEYYMGDSNNSGLSPEVVKELVKHKSHGALMRQTAGLMEQSNGAVKPFANENMEQFIKRLGGYVLRTHLQKAA